MTDDTADDFDPTNVDDFRDCLYGAVTDALHTVRVDRGEIPATDDGVAVVETALTDALDEYRRAPDAETHAPREQLHAETITVAVTVAESAPDRVGGVFGAVITATHAASGEELILDLTIRV